MTEPNGRYMYYPGCSIESSSRSYAMSTTAVVVEHLGLKMQEIDDWNCCGATEYFSVNALPAYSLVARNLSLAAEQGGGDVIAPCSACFLNLHKTDKYMGKYPDLNNQVNRALAAGNLHYEPGAVRVRHLLDVVVEDVGLDRVESLVKKPLKGLRVAPYYGCLIVRPDSRYNSEYPTHMDDLLRALGANVVDFPVKTHCCGGHMTQISEETAYELIRRILQNAAEYQTDVISTICPMCQLNLDAYQPQVNRMFGTNYAMPVLFFTQLMGLAFGIDPKDLGIGLEIVQANPALSRIGTEEEQPKKPKKRDKQALPMPPMD